MGSPLDPFPNSKDSLVLTFPENLGMGTQYSGGVLVFGRHQLRFSFQLLSDQLNDPNNADFGSLFHEGDRTLGH